MKYKTQIKINRLNKRLNDWILNVLCYPVNKIEKLIKSSVRKAKNSYKPNIYQWIEIK